jgi:hypothetical protein
MQGTAPAEGEGTEDALPYSILHRISVPEKRHDFKALNLMQIS